MQAKDFKFERFPYLKRNEVHIWVVHLPDSLKDIPYFTSILSRDEFQRANNFKFSKNQQYFIISRGILRYLIGKYLTTNPKNIQIVYGTCGKPYLSAKQPLHFNLSHSKDYALYAFTLNYEVGIDLEYINTNIEIDDLAISILCPEELDYWYNIDQGKVEAFFKIWVCKEAFLKASGKGWTSNHPILFDVFCNKKNSNMKFPYLFSIIPGYSSAFFINGPFLRPSYHTIFLNP